MKILGLFMLWLRSIQLHGAGKDFYLILRRLLKCCLFTKAALTCSRIIW